MTDPDQSLIAVLLDRSGSMQSIKSDTEGGLAAFFEEQGKVERTVRVTFAQFDTDYECLYSNIPLEQIPQPILHPRGGTALYDAIGKLVTDIGAELAGRPESERPGTVIVVILTDGHENSSREWTHSAVRSLIEQQQNDYNWDFLFLGANMDAVQIGTQLGFAPQQSITYGAAPAGVQGVFRAAGAYSTRLQGPGDPGSARAAGFTEEERQAADPGE
ncbi:vWA domain-containing protein [Nocardia sp. NPDC019395]|uniref:vWA domain-containing protein n=1 Tax=Nocardia sp. NPDC019395 TaxID=3154686 RepID=UPI0033CFF35A